MQVRVLGAHNLETNETHHTCFLVDDVLAIDAGSLVSTLGADEQRRVSTVLLTHLHFDHARDLPTLGLATIDEPTAIDVFSEQRTLDSVRAHLLDGEVYPDLTRGLNEGPPSFHFRALTEGQPLRVLDYDVAPVRADHPVPTVGYIVSANGTRVGFSGDTGGKLMSFFTHERAPQVLFVDVTFPDRLAERARRSKHLTPSTLKRELAEALAAGVTLPRIIPVHRGLAAESEVLQELAAVGSELGVDLEPGYENMVVG